MPSGIYIRMPLYPSISIFESKYDDNIQIFTEQKQREKHGGSSSSTRRKLKRGI